MKITGAKFAGSSTRIAEKPSVRLPEFAFIGRSNVGKSSLINMLCSNGRLAMTSSTPGKTKLVNHFLINDSWYLVDLPGYGYAKMPLKEKQKLTEIIRDYLNHSEELVELFILVDSRHDIQKADLDFIKEVDGSTIPYSIIFTKGDKLGPVALRRQIDSYKNQLLEHLAGMPECYITSAQSGAGRDEVLGHIETALSEIKKNQSITSI